MVTNAEDKITQKQIKHKFKLAKMYQLLNYGSICDWWEEKTTRNQGLITVK